MGFILASTSAEAAVAAVLHFVLPRQTAEKKVSLLRKARTIFSCEKILDSGLTKAEIVGRRDHDAWIDTQEFLEGGRRWHRCTWLDGSPSSPGGGP